MPATLGRDHTASICERLRQAAFKFLSGLIVAAIVGLFLWLITSLTGVTGAVAAAWWLDAISAGCALVGLVVTALAYLKYEWQRPRLDAARAEVLDELFPGLNGPPEDGDKR